MKFRIALLLLLGLYAAPANADTVVRPNAPLEVLTAETPGEVATQTGKILMSTWEGEDYDQSFPPFKWPKALVAQTDSALSVTINTDRTPAVEVRMWKKVRPNGIPKGKPHLVECFSDTFFPGQCHLKPWLSTTGLAWRATIEVPWEGHAYIAVLGNWSDAQVLWLNHLLLED